MANNKFRILTFDPGLSTTGWSLLEGTTDSDDITVIKMGEIHPGPVVDRAAYRDEIAKFDKRTISLAYLREQVTKLLNDLRPDAVCSEDIFINPKRPAAYGALAQWIAVVRMLCRDVARKYLVTIPTKICKLVVASSGSSGKLSVQQHIASSNHIKFKDPNDLMQMSEHQADSIAVGYALFVRYRDLINSIVEERNGKGKQ